MNINVYLLYMITQKEKMEEFVGDIDKKTPAGGAIGENEATFTQLSPDFHPSFSLDGIGIWYTETT